jgi:hypothetical protein
MLKTIVTLCLALASIAAAQPTRWLILNTANQNARRIWGLPICSDAPTDAQVLTYVGAEGCWKAQDSASGFANPMTTRGDLIYRSEAGTTRLALGANGQVLISDGTDALWGTLYPGVTGDGANGLTVAGKVSAASIEVGSPGTPSMVSFTQQVADPASAETGTDYTVYFLDGKMKQVSSTGDVASVGDTDFLPSIAADTVTIAAGKVRFANTYYGLSGGTAANPSGTGNVYFFLRPIDGSLAVAIGTGVTSAGTLTNIADAGAQDGVPEGGIPVATCAVDTDNYTTCTRTVALIGREKPMVGDSGAGGAMGMVPAPAAGDAAAGKYLKADGTWQTPAGSGSITVNTAAATSPNLSDSTPAAPSMGAVTNRGINVKWQKDASAPDNVSAYIPYGGLLLPTMNVRRWGVMVPSGVGQNVHTIGDQNAGNKGSLSPVYPDSNNSTLMKYTTDGESQAGTYGAENWRTGRNIHGMWEGKIGQTSGVRAWVTWTTNTPTSDVPTQGHLAGFRYSNCSEGCANDTNWQCVAYNGTESIADSGVPPSTTRTQLLEVIFDDDSDPRTLTFRIDGDPVCQFNSNEHSIPATGQNARLSFYIWSLDETAKDISLAWALTSADR